MTIQEYKTLVSEMRAAQKDYFKSRSKEALIKSKELESKVDDASIETGEEVFEGFVKFYIQGNVAIPVRSQSRDEAIAHAERIVSDCYGGLTYVFLDACGGEIMIEEQKSNKERASLEDMRYFIEEVMKQGYGGTLPNGRIADRRKNPEAVPFHENPLLGIPKPKEV